MKPPIYLFVPIHKGLRRLLFDVSGRLARADFADAKEVWQVLEQVETALAFCHEAATFSEVATHRTLQIKGKVTAMREPDEEERAFVERNRGLMGGQLALAGIPRSVTDRVRLRPCRAVDVEVREVFVQTPGPGAGAPLES